MREGKRYKKEREEWKEERWATEREGKRERSSGKKIRE